MERVAVSVACATMVPDGVKSSAVCKRGGESTDGEMNEMKKNKGRT